MDEFLDEVNPTHRGKIERWFTFLARDGPNLPRPYADVLEGKIRELRIPIAHHQYRFLYFFHGRLAVVTHGFLKKTRDVPKEEIERANRYMQDWMRRYGQDGGG